MIFFLLCGCYFQGQRSCQILTDWEDAVDTNFTENVRQPVTWSWPIHFELNSSPSSIAWFWLFCFCLFGVQREYSQLKSNESISYSAKCSMDLFANVYECIYRRWSFQMKCSKWNSMPTHNHNWMDSNDWSPFFEFHGIRTRTRWILMNGLFAYVILHWPPQIVCHTHTLHVFVILFVCLSSLVCSLFVSVCVCSYYLWIPWAAII